MSGSGHFVSDAGHGLDANAALRTALAGRLEPLPAAAQIRVLLDLVCAQTLEVLRAIRAEPVAAPPSTKTAQATA